ncbi:MAG: hypothetical protein Q9181_002767 [Wetmoreana brouardii]
MDESDVSQHNPFWDQLIPYDINNPPSSSNIDNFWDTLFPDNSNAPSAPLGNNRDNAPSRHHAFNNLSNNSNCPARNLPTSNSYSVPSSSTNHPSYRNLPTPPSFSNPPPPPSTQNLFDPLYFQNSTRNLPPPIPQPDYSVHLPGIESITGDYNAPQSTQAAPPSDRPATTQQQPQLPAWENVDYDTLFGDPGADFWSDFTDLGAGSGSNNIFDHNNLNGFVDLTNSSPITHTSNHNNNNSNGDNNNMPPTTRKRRASTSLPHPPSAPSAANALPQQAPHSRNSNKRLRTSLSDISNEGGEGEETKVDAIDLVDIDDDTSLCRILEQQQAAAIKAQSQTGGGGEGGNGPTKLSTVTCIICMESMTDMTVTHCGKAPSILLPLKLLWRSNLVNNHL